MKFNFPYGSVKVYLRDLKNADGLVNENNIEWIKENYDCFITKINGSVLKVQRIQTMWIGAVNNREVNRADNPQDVMVSLLEKTAYT